MYIWWEYPNIEDTDYLDYVDYAWLESLSRSKDNEPEDLYWYYYYE